MNKDTATKPGVSSLRAAYRCWWLAQRLREATMRQEEDRPVSDESDLTTRTVGDRIDGRLALALDPAYPLHNAWSHAYACDIGTLRAENRALRADLDGWRKANAILSKGMESQAELTDGLKQEARSLRASLEVERKLHDSNSAELVRRAASLERDRDELAAENARLRDALQAVLCDGRATPAMREAIKKALESP